MDDREPVLVTRSQIAEYLEISRAAVSNWQRRHADFPRPVPEGDGGSGAVRERFSIFEVIDWLADRSIPGDARHEHEPAGSTYADRLSVHARVHDPKPTRSGREQAVDRDTVRGLFDRFWRHGLTDSAPLLLALIRLRARDDRSWRYLTMQASSDSLDGATLSAAAEESALDVLRYSPHSLSRTSELSDAVRTIDRLGSGSEGSEKLTAAFDHAIEIFSERDRSQGGVIRTPPSVVRTMVDIFIDETPFSHIHDPFCRMGEFLVAAGLKQKKLFPDFKTLISGFDEGSAAPGLAEMYIGMHGLESDIRQRSTRSLSDDPWTHSVDLILTNPPFNSPLYAGPNTGNQYLKYGDPPDGNANFHWLQYAVSRLSENGRAAVLMTNNASTSANPRESEIRSRLVECGAVESVISLPDQLFNATGIPVTLWILRPPSKSADEVLFVDARMLGEMISRTQRRLTPEDTRVISDAYREWRSGFVSPASPESRISRPVTIHEIRDNEHSLHPPMYVPPSPPESEEVGHAESFTHLGDRLKELHAQAPDVDARVNRLLGELRTWIR